MNLKKMRLQAGLSQSQLAEKASVSLRAIQMFEIEQRNINIARIDIVAKLADAIGCRIDEILTDEKLKKILTNC